MPPLGKGSVPTDALKDRLHALGFRFHRQADRVEFWRKGGGTTVNVPRRDRMPAGQARATLEQAGDTHENIRAFCEANEQRE